MKSIIASIDSKVSGIVDSSVLPIGSSLSDVDKTVLPTELLIATDMKNAHFANLHGLGTVLSTINSVSRAGVPVPAATHKAEADDEGSEGSDLIVIEKHSV